MTFLKVIILFAGTTVLLSAYPALAEDTNCSSQRFGERCWQIFRADAGKSGSTSDNKDTGKLPGVIPSGYVVTGYTQVNESSNGGFFTSEFLAQGSKVSLISQSSSSYSRLNEIKNMLDQLVKFPNPKTGQQQEIRAKIDQLESEILSIQSALSAAYNADSNKDVFFLQAKSAYVCTKKAFGKCLDGYGNHGKGYVKANLVYVGGSSNEVNRINQQALNLQNAVKNSQNNDPIPTSRNSFRYKTGRFIKQSGLNWLEKRDNPPHSQLTEVSRTSDYIELFDSSRNLGVRIYNNRALWYDKTSKSWKKWPGSEGIWE